MMTGYAKKTYSRWWVIWVSFYSYIRTHTTSRDFIGTDKPHVIFERFMQRGFQRESYYNSKFE